ncbi:hypothetical protein HNY73_010808 [Argiope bruennichi]|uniref:Uncharacterized protein n=1 Tax=Argiope bruennichi TaxID=94029 RepID=A0A8T0F256_ARGBR|nr:hypothetical protein HNY73_010808 [Argiope bruennichi]
MYARLPRMTIYAAFICFCVFIAVKSDLPDKRNFPEDFENLTMAQLRWLLTHIKEFQRLFGHLARPRFGRSISPSFEVIMEGKKEKSLHVSHLSENEEAPVDGLDVLPLPQYEEPPVKGSDVPALPQNVEPPVKGPGAPLLSVNEEPPVKDPDVPPFFHYM